MRWLALVLAVFSFAAHTQPSKLPYFEEDPGPKPWEESEAQLPAFPSADRLIRFPVTPSNFEFFIDSASLTVGNDGVVRFALLARSASGVENVTFEGMRCYTGERRTYAFGQSNKSWSKVRASTWRPIGVADRSPQFGTLWNDYFCPGGMIISNAKEGLDALKWGVHPRARR
jgi:hypothetical protein